MTRPLRSILLVGVVLAALPAAGAAQAASYTTAQAEAGSQAYTSSACSACHMPDLTGAGDAPPLVGSSFQSNWDGSQVETLLEWVSENMPATAPGSLSDETYVNLIAYVLSLNGVAAGGAPLTMETDGAIVFGK